MDIILRQNKQIECYQIVMWTFLEPRSLQLNEISCCGLGKMTDN